MDILPYKKWEVGQGKTTNNVSDLLTDYRNYVS